MSNIPTIIHESFKDILNIYVENEKLKEENEKLKEENEKLKENIEMTQYTLVPFLSEDKISLELEKAKYDIEKQMNRPEIEHLQKLYGYGFYNIDTTIKYIVSNMNDVICFYNKSRDNDTNDFNINLSKYIDPCFLVNDGEVKINSYYISSKELVMFAQRNNYPEYYFRILGFDFGKSNMIIHLCKNYIVMLNNYVVSLDYGATPNVLDKRISSYKSILRIVSMSYTPHEENVKMTVKNNTGRIICFEINRFSFKTTDLESILKKL